MKNEKKCLCLARHNLNISNIMTHILTKINYQDYLAAKYGSDFETLQFTIPNRNIFEPQCLLNGKNFNLKLWEKGFIELMPHYAGSIDQGVTHLGDIRKISQFIIVPRIEQDDDFRTPFLIVFDDKFAHVYELTHDVRHTGGLRFYFSTKRPDSLTDDAILQVQGIELSASSPDARLDTVKWHFDVKPMF